MKQIIEELSKVAPLSDELIDFLTKNTSPFDYKKNEIIEHPGTICNHLYFIESGILIGDWVSEESSAPETNWILTPNRIATSYNSFFNGEISDEILTAGSDVKGRCINREKVEEALKFPEWVIIVNKLRLQYREDGTEFGARRGTKNPDAFYRFLQRDWPDILKYATNDQLADFMRISRETLRKTRNRCYKSVKKNTRH